METSTPTATDKKECKSSGVGGSSFTELPKKPSPTTLSRGTFYSHFMSVVLQHIAACGYFGNLMRKLAALSN